MMLKDNYMFNLVTMGDTLSAESSFVNAFFNSFNPEEKNWAGIFMKAGLVNFLLTCLVKTVPHKKGHNKP